jgi:hypothetical protein
LSLEVYNARKLATQALTSTYTKISNLHFTVTKSGWYELSAMVVVEVADANDANAQAYLSFAINDAITGMEFMHQHGMINASGDEYIGPTQMYAVQYLRAGDELSIYGKDISGDDSQVYIVAGSTCNLRAVMISPVKPTMLSAKMTTNQNCTISWANVGELTLNVETDGLYKIVAIPHVNAYDNDASSHHCYARVAVNDAPMDLGAFFLYQDIGVNNATIGVPRTIIIHRWLKAGDVVTVQTKCEAGQNSYIRGGERSALHLVKLPIEKQTVTSAMLSSDYSMTDSYSTVPGLTMTAESDGLYHIYAMIRVLANDADAATSSVWARLAKNGAFFRDTENRTYLNGQNNWQRHDLVTMYTISYLKFGDTITVEVKDDAGDDSKIKSAAELRTGMQMVKVCR